VWILDVAGQRLVIDTPQVPGQSATANAEVQGILESIRLAPVAATSPSPVASPSPESSPSLQAAHMTVAGTDVSSSPLQFTADLPSAWTNITFGANRGGSQPPAGMAFIVSLVDDTFQDPCSHVERSPKVGPTIADAATAIGEIPGLTATPPEQSMVAGHAAMSIELTVPASLPCAPDQFYLWQDSAGGDWWVQGLNERIQVWIFEVGGRRVAIATHSYSGTSTAAKAELRQILDSIVFDAAP
jgi:hypothetical protein